jgi:hypothetical protein
MIRWILKWAQSPAEFSAFPLVETQAETQELHVNGRRQPTGP